MRTVRDGSLALAPASGDMTKLRSLTGAGDFMLLLLLTLVVAVTRLPLAGDYLFSFEAVNLALGIEYFDLHLHQPHPPGYPAFIVQARILKSFLPSTEDALFLCGFAATLAATLLLYRFGERVFSRSVGFTAAVLLALNPVFWHASLASPSRPYLAAVAVLVACLSHRAAGGEPRFAYYSAIALGIGAGWQPSVLVTLAPFWLLCTWFGLRKLRRIALAILLLAVATTAWLLPLTVVLGGPEEVYRCFTDYLRTKAGRVSPLYGAGHFAWWEMASQVFAWHVLMLAGWVWSTVLFLVKRPAGAATGGKLASALPAWLLGVVWAAPSLCLSLLLYAERPGQTLTVAPVFCLAGAVCLDRAAIRASSFLRSQQVPRLAFLAVAIGINLLLFILPSHMPGPHAVRGGWLSGVVEQIRFRGALALYRTSRVHLEAVNLATSDRIHFLEALNGPPVRAVVWQDDDVSWRKIAYYFPSYPTWVLEGLSGSSSRRRPLLWLHKHLERVAEGDETYPILVPDRGQLAWLLHPYSPLPAALKSQGVPLCQFGTMFLTDLKRAPQRFRAGPYVFQKTGAAEIQRSD